MKSHISVRSEKCHNVCDTYQSMWDKNPEKVEIYDSGLMRSTSGEGWERG